jgi:hypothetical protein
VNLLQIEGFNEVREGSPSPHIDCGGQRTAGDIARLFEEESEPCRCRWLVVAHLRLQRSVQRARHVSVVP